MNFLEVLGIIFIVETIVEVYFIYKYRFVIRQLFFVASAPRPTFTPEQVEFAFGTDEKPYRDERGRFAKRPA